MVRGSVSTISSHSKLPCQLVDLAVLSGLWMLALAVPLASSAFSSTFSTLESAQQTFKAANSMPCRGHTKMEREQGGRLGLMVLLWKNSCES